MGLDLYRVYRFIPHFTHLTAVDPLIGYDWICRTNEEKALQWIKDLLSAPADGYTLALASGKNIVYNKSKTHFTFYVTIKGMTRKITLLLRGVDTMKSFSKWDVFLQIGMRPLLKKRTRKALLNSRASKNVYGIFSNYGLDEGYNIKTTPQGRCKKKWVKSLGSDICASPTVFMFMFKVTDLGRLFSL